MSRIATLQSLLGDTFRIPSAGCQDNKEAVLGHHPGPYLSLPQDAKVGMGAACLTISAKFRRQIVLKNNNYSHYLVITQKRGKLSSFLM